MDYRIIARFKFLAEALHGTGGFMPQVPWGLIDGMQRPKEVVGACHITPHLRESPEKYANRVACAVYENHLRQACERFVAYLARKSPSRQGADSPPVELFLNDADGAGNSLDVVLHRLAIDTKARGSMLLLVDLPDEAPDGPISMAELLTGQRRLVPYLVPIKPEQLADYQVDERGQLRSVSAHGTRMVGDKLLNVVRRWTDARWEVWYEDKLIAGGEHPFGVCPVLALTENGAPFPQVGKYAQIADLSNRLYNGGAELTDIQRSQIFSVLTVSFPPEMHDIATAMTQTTATIGTHSLLAYQGSTAPAFISPDGSSVQSYISIGATQQASIDRIGMETASQPGQQQESGAARKMRFEALNADLAGFARLLQGLEAKIWHLFHFSQRLVNRVQVQYPTDYNLTDTAAELDILALMQATGHPEAVLREKRRAIVLAEFDRAPSNILAALMAALDEQEQELTP